MKQGAATDMSRPCSPSCRLILGVTLRAVVLLLLCLIFGAFHLFVTPRPRLFFCDDQSLRYPSQPSTVPYYVCAPVGLALALLVICSVELTRSAVAGAASAASAASSTSAEMMLTTKLLSTARSRRRAAFVRSLQAAYFFCLGCAATELLTVTAKLALGRHRPSFLEVCRAELPLDGRCNASVAYPVSVCRPVVSARDFADAQMSFPSGHTSYSMYVAAFLVGFLRARFRGCNVTRFCLQLAILIAGLYVGYTRLSDYKHHWADVLGGAALGAAVAVAALRAAGLGDGGGGGGGRAIGGSFDDDAEAASTAAAAATASGDGCARRRRLRDEDVDDDDDCHDGVVGCVNGAAAGRRCTADGAGVV